MMRTVMHPFCILKTPHDIVINAVSGYGYNPGDLCKNNCFTNVIISLPQEVLRHDD